MVKDNLIVQKGPIDWVAIDWEPYWPDLFTTDMPCQGCDAIEVQGFEVVTWDLRIEDKPAKTIRFWCFDCLSRQVKAVKESEIAGTILDFSE